MTNVFKANESKIVEVSLPTNNTNIQVEEVPIADTKSFNNVKDVKCFGSISPDGKKIRCRRKCVPGTAYCLDHQPKVEKVEEHKKTCMTPDTAVRSLLSFHLGIYLLMQELSKNTESSSLEGLTDIFREQKQELEQIYKDIVATYGEEEVARYIGPFTALSFVSAQQILEAYKGNKKKDSSSKSLILHSEK